MKTRIRKFLFSEISKDLYCKLSRLRLSDGLLWQTIKKNPNNVIYVLYINENNKPKPIAWTAVFENKTKNIKMFMIRKYSYMIYVQAKYRRKGFGTKLSKRVIKDYNSNNLNCYRYSNFDFFETLPYLIETECFDFEKK